MPLPTDPLLNQQWHLGNPIAGLFDLNVRAVWNPEEGLAYTGAGIRAVVIDNGFDYLHPDFDNYNQFLDYDFENNTLNPFGAPSESHGTAVAGIIGAAADGTGAVGVAYGTELVGYRTANLISDAWLQDIRDAIAQAATNAQGDVANISQGIANDAASEFGVGYNAVRFDEIETSIGTAVTLGRGGLGMTIVKSAGNSRADNYDVNADDWTNDTRQVVVGAVDQNGFVSSYSSYGAALLVSAFGTPGEVLTTDRVGAAGYTNTDFTSTFNGTSAAAPMVSGVVSLMYDANSGLGWRDVQSILAASARHVGSAVGGPFSGAERFAWGWNHSTTWNGGGMHFSNDYGYGLVDALAVVRLAETWLLAGGVAQTTSNEFTNTVDMLNVATVIPDGNTTGLTFNGNAVFDDNVDRVTVQMTFSTTFTGDLEVYVTSPDGTVSQLIADTGGGNDFNGTWTFETQAFRGERAAGQWSVRVVDDSGGDVLTVSDIVLKTYGQASNDDRYVFTNEYSDYDGVGGHLTAITDSNGGTDTVNAAAVSSNSTIHLDGVAGSIDGVAVSFANVENAIGGDGNDFLYGNATANELIGGRGSDQLFGQGGADILRGGTGNDYLFGGAGADSLFGDTGIDVAFYETAVRADLTSPATNTGDAAGDVYDSIEGLAGGNNWDTLLGNASTNYLFGNGGTDFLFGLGGVDYLYGGDQDDYLNGGASGDNFDGGNGLDYTSYEYAGAALTVDLLYTYLNTGEAAGDTFISMEGIVGSNYGDSLFGSNTANTIYGQSGNDTIFGRDGADVLSGGNGNDLLFGEDGNDYLFGNLDTDYLFGGAGSDHLYGEDGFDFAAYSYSASGLLADLLYSYLNVGEAGGDQYAGVEGIIGSAYGDDLRGEDGNNAIFGGNGNDVIYGRGGNDYIAGEAGNDFLVGEGGNDTFVFQPGSGQDGIADFAGGTGPNDVLQILMGAAYDSFAEIMNIAQQVGSNTVITFDTSTSITLYGATKLYLNADDFAFA